MAHGRNKYQSRESRQRVRFVLNKHWDPIGVVKDPDVDDEYDNYVGAVYVMLMDDRASERAVEAYLYETATRHIGLSPGAWLTERCAETAAILVALRPEFETH
jgi:hypothetical protein